MKLFLISICLTLLSCQQTTKSKALASDAIKVDTVNTAVAESSLSDDGQPDSTIIQAKHKADLLYKSALNAKDKPVRNADLEEINTHFTYRGAYINPLLINELIPWESDQKDAIMAIDIAPYNVGSNKFYNTEPPYKTNDGYIKIVEKSTDHPDTDNYYYYKWLGMLSNKVHVIKFVQDGNGFSGVFPALIFVRFDINTHMSYGKYYKQLLMHNIAIYRMGDRTEFKVQLNKHKNSVTVMYKEFNDSIAKYKKESIQL